MSRWDHPELNDVIEALNRVFEAREECDKAHREYDGCSWGYHGQHLIQAVDDATDNLAAKLNDLIDARIAERINRA